MEKLHPSVARRIAQALLTITARDSFTLSTPRLSTSLKQGDTQTVLIGIAGQEL